MTAFRNLHCPQTNTGNHYCPSFEKLVLRIFLPEFRALCLDFSQNAQEVCLPGSDRAPHLSTHLQEDKSMVRDIRDSWGRSPCLRRSSSFDVRGASSHQFPIRSQRSQGSQLPDVVCDSKCQASPMVSAIATATTRTRTRRRWRGAGAAARGED